MTKCVVQPPGSSGAELVTIDIINFQKIGGLSRPVMDNVRWSKSNLDHSKCHRLCMPGESLDQELPHENSTHMNVISKFY